MNRPDTTRAPAHEATVPPGPVRVLIVEDRPVARKLLGDELAQSSDIQVSDVASNGDDAVRLVRETHPDIVIMDLVMPGKDGIETISEIRGFSDVPIVLLTGATVATESLEYVARRKGANGFIRKPSGPVSVDLYRITEELVGEIRRLTKDRGTPRGVAQHPESRPGKNGP